MSVEAAVSAAILSPAQATRLPLQGRTRMATRTDSSCGEPAACLPLQRNGVLPNRSSNTALRTAHPTAKAPGGFTLAELAVSIGVLVLIVFLATQLLKSAANITTLGHKQMDADSQTRQLFDRMSIDFDHMVRRSDIDYYIKSSSFATGAPPGPAGVRTVRQSWLMDDRGAPFNGNDQIAFYCTVPGYGYFPTPAVESPLSIVAYRINQNTGSPTNPNPAYLRLERMGRGLLWNAAPTPPPNLATPTPTATPFSAAPTVFIPVPLASPLPALEWPGAPAATPACVWAASNTASWGSESEIIGPDVFRFEYYYMLKSQTDPINPATFYPAVLTDTPWDTRICSPSCPTAPPIATPTPTGTPIATPTPPSVCCHVSPQGMQDVAAIVVSIAVIDPKSRVLLSDSQIATIAGKLIDYGSSSPACSGTAQWQAPGELLRQWQCALDNDPAITNLPRPAISGIRVYERYFYLRPPTLLTP